MRNNLFIAAAFAATLAFKAAAAQLPVDTPLIVDGPIKVDAGDLEGFMMARVPDARRAEFRASYERVAGMVDNLFIARSLAAKARAAGLDQDPVVQRRLAQVQEALLADLYIQQMEKDAPKVNLDQRARELYKADAAKFVKPESVHVQHLLVDLKGRTREMALERAKQIHAEAKSGKEDFLALAGRYSDDSDKKRNGGDLGYNSPKSFVEPVVEAIARMSTKGEISEPIESHMGFHIVRFVDRKKAEPMKFEEVRNRLIENEKERLSKKRVEDLVKDVRNSSTVTVHRDSVEAMVIPVEDVLSKAAAQPAPKQTP
jgi:parvulin-like peptidyl-prolyl isomerase